MATKPLALEGLVSKKSRGDDEEELQELRRRNQQLEAEIRQLRAEIEEARAGGETAQRVIRNLRDQLNPLHRALRAIFGEIELAVDESEPQRTSMTPGPQSNAADPRWESYKTNFPGVPATIVDALLSHRAMTLTQLAGLLRRDYSTIKTAVLKLTKAGAVTREGKGGPVRLNT